jgi:hypothetical protein
MSDKENHPHLPTKRTWQLSEGSPPSKKLKTNTNASIPHPISSPKPQPSYDTSDHKDVIPSGGQQSSSPQPFVQPKRHYQPSEPGVRRAYPRKVNETLTRCCGKPEISSAPSPLVQQGERYRKNYRQPPVPTKRASSPRKHGSVLTEQKQKYLISFFSPSY